MGHVNPAACLPRKESWRWETTNSEYGKFYVRKTERPEGYDQVIGGIDEFQSDYSKKCEELTNELLEAKAQLERLKISHTGLQDTACQTSPTKLRPPSRKTLYKSNGKMDMGDDSQMLLCQGKDLDPCHPVKRLRPCLKLRNNGRNSQAGSDSSSRSPNSGSVNDHRPSSIDKRKIWQKEGGIPKKQKGSMVKEPTLSSNLKHTAGGGANLPPSQRYTFYRNFDEESFAKLAFDSLDKECYGGQGAKTSKGWHSKTSPWHPI